MPYSKDRKSHELPSEESELEKFYKDYEKSKRLDAEGRPVGYRIRLRARYILWDFAEWIREVIYTLGDKIGPKDP